MPYQREGKIVFKIVGGKKKKVGESDSVEKAKSHMRTLQAVEHGWKPTKRKSA